MTSHKVSRRAYLIVALVALVLILACSGVLLFFPSLDERRVQFSVRLKWLESPEIASVAGWYITDIERAMTLKDPWILEDELGKPNFELESPGDVDIPSVAAPFSNVPRVLPTAALIRIKWSDGTGSILRKNLVDLGVENREVWLEIEGKK